MQIEKLRVLHCVHEADAVSVRANVGQKEAGLPRRPP